ncbi:unnamed protein product, partial [Symbiodinium natans]
MLSACQQREITRIEQGWAPVESREWHAQLLSGWCGGVGFQLMCVSPLEEAAWFDTGTDQYDLFGRPRAPTPDSPKFYVEWSKVSRTAEWSCGPPGCVADASLKVFENASEMEYKMCLLSVSVHATDFDDTYGREKIEWILINDKEAQKCSCETDDNPAALHGTTVTEQQLSNVSLLATHAEPVRSSDGDGTSAELRRGHRQDCRIRKRAMHPNKLARKRRPLMPSLYAAQMAVELVPNCGCDSAELA